MKSFINVEDLGPLDKAMAEAFEIKNDRFKYQHLGKNKTLMMIFFNNSLRTRLSTQKAAMNLGMNVIVLDVNAGAWKLETERGVIMDGDKSERPYWCHRPQCPTVHQHRLLAHRRRGFAYTVA